MESQPVVGGERVLGGGDEQSHLRDLLGTALGRPPADVPPADLRALAERNDIPLPAVAALVDLSGDESWAVALAAAAEAAEVRRATVSLVASALGGLAPYVAWCVSPVRPDAGSDVDLLLPPWMLREASSRLAAAGLVPLPRWDTDGSRTFVRVDGGRVVDRVDLTAGPSSSVAVGRSGDLGRLTPDALRARTAARVAERGVVRVADLWDLAVVGWPESPPPLLARARTATSFPVGAPRRSVRSRLPRREPAPRTYRVAFSGIDGSGKTTQVRALVASLEAAGATVTTVWNRPGFQLRVLDLLARPVKRVLREDSKPTLDRQLAGEPAAAAARSRSGLVGWVWLLLICLTSLARTWRGALRGHRRGGVVIFERHLLDALVDVEWQYPGVRRGFHRWLLRVASPRPDLAVRMVLDPDVAFARNPYDVFRHEHMAAHAVIADRLAPSLGPFLTLDSAQPLPGLLARVLDTVLAAYAGRPPPPDPRAACWRVLLPATVDGAVALVDLPAAVREPLRAAFPRSVALGRDLADGVVWDGVRAPLRPGAVSLVVAGTPHAPDAPARALLVPSRQRHDVAIYPSTEHPERLFARGWPTAAAGPWRRRVAQMLAGTPGWKLLRRSGLRLSGVPPSLADDVLAAVGGGARLRGLYAGNGQVVLRARAPSGDVAVRLATSADGAARLAAQQDALAAVRRDVPEVAPRLPVPAGAGTTAGMPWVAERWVAATAGPGGPYWHASGRGWHEARDLAATLGARPTGATSPGWARAWAERLADLGDVVVEAMARALAPLGGGVPTAWCHGDLWPGNLLAGSRVAGVAIDWDHARADAPAGIDAVYAEVWRRALDSGTPYGAAAAALLRDGAPALAGTTVGGRDWAVHDRATRRALVAAAYVLHVAQRPRERLGPDWVTSNVAPVLAELTDPGPPPPETDTTPTTDLGSRAARGTLWLAAAALVSKGTQTVTLIVLAALLAPRDLGVLSIGALVFNVLLVLQDLGVADVISLRRDRVEETARTALTMLIAGATALTVAVWVAAPALARFFHAPDGVAVIRGLTLVLPGYAAAAVPLAFMQRHLDFRRRFVPDAVPALAGGALTIGLAYAGHGVASLVAGQILQGVLVPVLAWLIGRRVRPGWDAAIAREIVRYGRHIAGAGVLQLSLLNVDYAVVARVLGEVTLGWYSLAFRICYLPYVNVTYVVNGAAFHYYNRLPSRSDLGAAIARVTSTVVVGVTPLAAALFLFSNDVALLGARWAPAAVAIRGLAAYALALSLCQTAQVALKAAGRPDQFFASRLLHLAGLTGTLLLVTRHGIGAVALGQFAVAAALAAITWAWLARAVALPGRDLARGLLAPVTGAFAMAAVTAALQRAPGFSTGPDWRTLLVAAPAALLAYAATIALLAGPQVAQTVRAVRGRG